MEGEGDGASACPRLGQRWQVQPTYALLASLRSLCGQDRVFPCYTSEQAQMQ